MDCIGPVTPDNNDFLAYADRAASSETREHIQACPACRERALQIVHEQRELHSLLHRAGCPRSLELGEYHLGLLGEQRSAELAEHLAYCPACRTELADLAAFMRRLRRPFADAAGDAIGALRIVVAKLSVSPAGGLQGAPVPVLRGADSGQGPTVYDAEDTLVTVDSWIERLGQPGRIVAGLVVGPEDFTGAEASIDEAATFTTAPVNDLGNFLLADVPAGVHHLTIRLPASGIQIEINELTVK